MTESTLSFSYGVTGIERKPIAAAAAGTASAHQRGHSRRDRGGEAEQQDRHDVEEVASLTSPAPKRWLNDATWTTTSTSAVQPTTANARSGRRRGTDAVDQPAGADDEGQDREPQRQHGHVLEEELDEREVDPDVLRRDRVRAEQLGALVDRDRREHDEQERPEEDDERTPRPPELARARRADVQAIASATTASSSTARRTTNCVRASTATPIAASASRSVCHRFRSTAWSGEQRPAEHRVRDDLGEQERQRTIHGTATVSAPAQSASSRPSPSRCASRRPAPAAVAITNAFRRCASAKLAWTSPSP